MVLALLLSVIGADVCAQEVADSVWVDSVEVDSVALTEEFKSDYDSEEEKAEMDSLIQARYVIVSMNGKYGIYDREKNDSVTAVDMDYIEYSHYFQPENGMCFCYFYYEKGLQCGKIGINMNDNTKMEAFADYPRLVGNVEDFPAIDSLILARSYDVLGECMKAIDGIQGQVAVIDARTSDVLTWGALENVEGDIVYAPLLKRLCSSETYMPFVAADCLAQSKTSLEDSVDTGHGILVLNESVQIRDHNWRRACRYVDIPTGSAQQVENWNVSRHDDPARRYGLLEVRYRPDEEHQCDGTGYGIQQYLPFGFRERQCRQTQQYPCNCH